MTDRDRLDYAILVTFSEDRVSLPDDLRERVSREVLRARIFEMIEEGLVEYRGGGPDGSPYYYRRTATGGGLLVRLHLAGPADND